MADGADAGLALIEALRPGPAGLERHHLLHAARAELLRRAGRDAEAAEAYRRALALPPAGATTADLQARLAGL